jgi:hypothetical protein
METMQFLRFIEAHHKIAFAYPARWAVAHTDAPGASIIVQITCDEAEESYKRFSVAYDDVSWSAHTAQSFGQHIAAELPQLVPGSHLVSHGLFEPDRRKDGAYELVYRVRDDDLIGAGGGSELQLLNVVVLSTHGAARRAYTLTFAADADAFGEVQKLARHMINSFTVDGCVAASRSGAAGAHSGGGGGGATPGTPTNARAISGEEVHVNVWDRGRTDATAAATAASVAALVPETSSVPSEVAWAQHTLVEAGLMFVRPAAWTSSGLVAPGALTAAAAAGGRPFSQSASASSALVSSTLVQHHAAQTVRRVGISFTCDRREACYKQLSVACVDVTPCMEVLLRKGRGGAAAADPSAFMLQYILARYQAELLEGPGLASLLSDERLRPWADLFRARWPVECRLSTLAWTSGPDGGAGSPPLPRAGAPPGSSGAAPPQPTQAKIVDQRVVATSRLLKVTGVVRTGVSSVASAGASFSSGGGGAAGGASGGSTAASGPRRHGSAYSNVSMSLDGDVVPAEGLLLPTTSAVLLGLHEAAVQLAPGSAAAAQRRVFVHVVTFTTSSDAFQRYEPLAKRVFQGLETVARPE